MVVVVMLMLRVDSCFAIVVCVRVAGHVYCSGCSGCNGRHYVHDVGVGDVYVGTYLL